MNSHFFRIQSLQCSAIEPHAVNIEALRTRGLSQLSLTGLPDAWLRDSRDKIRALVAQHGDWKPMDRLLVHLLPAEQSKAGAHLELPIVLACLGALAGAEFSSAALALTHKFRFVGALSLDGKLTHTELSYVLEDSDPDSTLGPSHFASLKEVWEFICHGQCTPPAKHIRSDQAGTSAPYDVSIEVETVGKHWERYWLLLAAITETPVLLIGPPGGGKSHLARWAHRLLPDLSIAETIKKRQVWSLAGLVVPEGVPVLTPHSRIQLSELMGMARAGMARPGIFSLAHLGLLILDEFPELNHDCREVLRTVLDQKQFLRNTRAGTSLWPAKFWLIATANPCPCGGARCEDTSDCRCGQALRTQYLQRFSGPLLDRMGVRLFVSPQNKPEAKDAPLRVNVVESDAATLKQIVKDTRGELPCHFAESLKRIQSSPTFAQHSVRDQHNKARLHAAMCLVEGKADREGVFLGLLEAYSHTEKKLLSRNGYARF